jgi:hypothetical protein
MIDGVLGVLESESRFLIAAMGFSSYVLASAAESVQLWLQNGGVKVPWDD